jgi:hypothetical protein
MLADFGGGATIPFVPGPTEYPMSRRFQFSLGRMLLATAWLALGSAAVGAIWRTDLQFSPRLIALVGLILAGIGGAIGAMTGTPAIRHSFYGAIVGLAAQAGIVGFAFLMNR